jgi:penicillin amidase
MPGSRGERGRAGRGAPEFFLFSNEIAAWAPADSMAILKLMALQLSAHLETEVLRARLSLILPPERLADILPDDPGQGVAALPDYASLVPGVVPLPRPGRFCKRAYLVAGWPDPWPGGASNAWAAMPGRSAAGGSLLANDPHLGLTAPTIWYLARLELQSGGVIGGTIPACRWCWSGAARRSWAGA